MSPVRTVTVARCIVCDWSATTGDVDLAARKHTGERGVKGDGADHPTVTETTPVGGGS